MNAKISVFAICVEAIIYLLLRNLYDCTFNMTQSPLPETHLQIQAATRIEVGICFFYGAPCTQHFYSVKCSKSFLLGRIYGEQSLSFLMLVFHHNSTQISRIYF